MNLKHLKKIFNYKLINLQKRFKTSIVVGYPYWLTLDPSNICNLRCVFCPTGQKRDCRTKTIMQFDKVKQIIDKLGPYLIHTDLCNWGEPFLNKDIYKIIFYIKKFGSTVKVDTNFNIEFTKEDAKDLIWSRLDQLTISLDGVEQKTYEIYRQGGIFNKVLENIKTLVKTKRELKSVLPHIHWQFLVFKHNEHEIEKAKNMALEIGVDSIGFTAPYCSPDWVSSIDEYNRYKNSNGKIEYKKVEKICNWLWDGITINANGSVSPCCSVEDEKDDFDNFFNKPFWKIWNGKKYRVARKFVRDRKPVKENNICTNCDHIGASNHREISFK